MSAFVLGSRVRAGRSSRVIGWATQAAKTGSHPVAGALVMIVFVALGLGSVDGSRSHHHVAGGLDVAHDHLHAGAHHHTTSHGHTQPHHHHEATPSPEPVDRSAAAAEGPDETTPPADAPTDEEARFFEDPQHPSEPPRLVAEVSRPLAGPPPPPTALPAARTFPIRVPLARGPPLSHAV